MACHHLLLPALAAALLGAAGIAAAGGYEASGAVPPAARADPGSKPGRAPAAGAGEAGAPPEPSSGESSCGASLAARVQERYEAIRTLAANFRQVSRSAALAGAAAEVEESRGHVVLARPGRMRWSYDAPEPSLVVSDGSTLWIYDPAGREVQKLPVGQGFLSAAAVQFLLGEGRLDESFHIRGEDCRDGRGRLVLTPREPATYERLVLEVDGDTGLVRATEVHDLFGGVVRIEFSDVELDRPVGAEEFRFEVPEGVDVIELPGAAG